MSMTETFKDLPPPATGAALVELGKVTQSLKATNMQTINDLTERLEPLGHSMALLTEAVTRSMLDLKTFVGTANDAVRAVTQRADEAAARLAKKSDAITAKLWASMIGAALLISVGAVSAYCVWQHKHLGETAAAAKWHTFEDTVFPKLDKRTQELIRRTWLQ